MKSVTLDAAKVNRLTQPVVGNCGFQSLLRHLQKNRNQQNDQIVLTDEDRGRICGHAYDYENGC